MSSIQDEKKALRTKLIESRLTMPADVRQAADAAIAASVLKQPEFRAAKQVFAYVSMQHEVGTAVLLSEIVRAGKVLGLPVCDANTHTLTFYRLNAVSELKTGMYRIPVPPVTEDRRLVPDAKTLVILPMLAFDPEGYRLGAGGGYYDRFLAAYGNTVRVLGICYAENRLAALPHDEYDRQIPCCVTEQKREERNV